MKRQCGFKGVAQGHVARLTTSVLQVEYCIHYITLAVLFASSDRDRFCDVCKTMMLLFNIWIKLVYQFNIRCTFTQ